MKTYNQFVNQIDSLPKLKPTRTNFATTKRSDGLSQTIKHETYDQVNILRSEILSSDLYLSEKTHLIELLSNKYQL